MPILPFLKKSVQSSSILTGAADCHSHILPGVDDGIRDMDEAIETLGMLEGYGISNLVLTPHVMENYPNTGSGLREVFSRLKSAYHGGMRLRLAAEYMIDGTLQAKIEAGDLLELGGRRVLVETSTWAEPLNMYDVLYGLLGKGYIPVLAHPERYRYLSDTDIERLRKMGVQLQLNLPSLCGLYSPQVSKRARELLLDGRYACFGSDCHRGNVTDKAYREAKVLDKKAVKALEKIALPDFI